MKLRNEQIELVERRLTTEGIKNDGLYTDVLDHLCCVVEIDLKNGKSFDISLENAIKDLAPQGLADLENQTRFLLNSKRIIIMKKLMYTAGFIGAVFISMGSLFKIMHWPYANILLTSGMIFFLLLFVPLFALDRYKVQASKAMSAKFKIIAGVLAAFLVGTSVIFKIFHLMGAHILLVSGVFVFTFGYLPFLFFSLYKRSVS